MKTALTLALIVILMGAAAFFVTKLVVFPAMSDSTENAEEVTDTAEESGDAAEGAGEVYLVENILVNPKGTGGTRYLSTSLGLEVKSAQGVQALTERDLQVRDLLNSILASRTVSQLTDPIEREDMRKEIQERLNRMLGGEELTAIYFVDYVMQ